MSTTELHSSDASGSVRLRTGDQKLEVMVIPVGDVDRARDFYVRLGWRLDATPPWVVQLTPPGSSCSLQFGEKLSSAAPGSAKGYLIVSDLVETRKELVAKGIEVGELYHLTPDGPVDGPDPERRSYNTWMQFGDPDGNVWVMQEITSRLPGRLEPGETSYADAGDLASALRRAAAAHGEHEKRTGEADPNWPDWYAEYMVAERGGAELPT
jgi:catechol 2,3-dioxygenase-like lactoylglutathione lyase family enzyme